MQMEQPLGYVPRSALSPVAELAKGAGYLRRDASDPGAASPASSLLRRDLSAAQSVVPAQPSAARQSLRDRLMKPQASR